MSRILFSSLQTFLGLSVKNPQKQQPASLPVEAGKEQFTMGELHRVTRDLGLAGGILILPKHRQPRIQYVAPLFPPLTGPKLFINSAFPSAQQSKIQ